MVPNLGNLIGGSMSSLVKALPTREAIEALAASIGESARPAIYRLDMRNDGAQFAASANLRIVPKYGPLVITEVNLGPTNGNESIELIPDEDVEQQQGLIAQSASASLLAPITVRKQLHVAVSDSTEENTLDEDLGVSLAGFHVSARLLALIESLIGVSWARSVRLSSTAPTKIVIPRRMSIVALRMMGTTTTDLSISISGRYIFPQGFAACAEVAQLLGPSANQRQISETLAGTGPMSSTVEGLPQIPIDVDTGDEIVVGPVASTGYQTDTVTAALNVIGRVRR